MAELSSEETFRRDCLARHLLRRWSREEITNWLNDPKKTERFREDMRTRFNTQKRTVKPQ